MEIAAEQLRLQARRLRRWIIAVVASLVLIIAIAVPLVHFLIEESDLHRNLQIHVRWTAETLSHAISRSPNLWQYQVMRMEDELEDVTAALPSLYRRILAADGSPIVTSGEVPEWPAVTESAELRDGLRQVGTVVSSASLRPLLSETALIALIGGAVAALVFVVLRYHAVYLLDRAVAALSATQENLRGRLVDLETHRRALEDQRQVLAEAMADVSEARDQAEAANRAKSEFLASMSHELRTPLNAILGFSEIIQEEILGPIKPVKYVEYAKDIHDSGQHLLDLINDLLDLSKIEAGKMTIEPVPLDVRGLIARVVRLFMPAAERLGLTILAEPAQGVPALWADERAARQILLNLLSNAVKFTPRGGRIVVSACEVEGDAVEIAVKDSGIGIPASQIERLMRPFEQLDNAYQKSEGGTGLGLSLVAGLAALHGGTVRVESREGEGTTVAVRLPIMPGAKLALRERSPLIAEPAA